MCTHFRLATPFYEYFCKALVNVMSYGITVIQVVPIFCLNKIRCCKASNFFGDLRCVSAIYTALACFKSATWLKLITTMQEKTKTFTFFSCEIKTPTPVEVTISTQLGRFIKIF